jgi:TPP-dependent pyruvate/acetoin dehydrogenase alpha subunit
MNGNHLSGREMQAMQKCAELGKDRLMWMWTQMVRIREFEERVKRTFVEQPGVIRGHTHLADGGEASIVGTLTTRAASDPVVPTYRCHGYPLVLGTSARSMMAEIYGRRDGLCKGYGGSMHLSDPARHFPGPSGIIGQGIAHATGMALGVQIKSAGDVTYCFFGDGSTKQGVFFESVNMAAIWKLPIVYFLENNEYQAYTRVKMEDANVAAGDPLSKKAEAFSIPGMTVDGTDVLQVYEAARAAVDRARAGHGPSLVETKFYRFSAHGNSITVPPVPTKFGDHEAVEIYCNSAEYEAAKSQDPIPKFRSYLIEREVLSEAAAKKIEDDARAEMEDAVQFALASPFPAPEDAPKFVYA